MTRPLAPATKRQQASSPFIKFVFENAHLARSSKDMKKFQSKSKALIKFVEDLKKSGIDKETPLPRLVVIGDQSSGKSALISAIAQVTLPSSEGTTTRCPTLVKLRSGSDKFECVISLQFNYATYNNQHQKLDAYPDVMAFAKTNKSEEVAKLVADAQRKMLELCPHVNHKAFKNWDDLKKKLIQPAAPLPSGDGGFTRNMIVLDVSGAAIDVDLDIIDLPGLVSTNHPANRVIENFVDDHIKEKRTAIIALLTCGSDYANQDTGNLIQRYPNWRSRTVTVMTQADLITVKGSGPGWKDARTKEAKDHPEVFQNPFFVYTKDKWSKDVELAKLQEIQNFIPSNFGAISFGVAALRVKLSEMLVKRIAESMDDIKSEIQRKYLEVREMLSALGEGPRLYSFSRECEVFRGILESFLGVTGRTDLYKAMLDIFSDFQSSIEKTAPKFISNDWQTKMEQEVASSQKDQSVLKGVYSYSGLNYIMSAYPSRGIPGTSVQGPIDHVLSDFVNCWTVEAERCVTSCQAVVLAKVEEQIEKQFGKFPKLCNVVRELTQTYVRQTLETTMERVFEIVEGLKSRPATIFNRCKFEKVKATERDDLLHKVEFHSEEDSVLRTAADIIAYYKYTSNHLGEAIPQSILYNFLIPLPLLKNNIYDACNPFCDPKKDHSYLEEDPQKAFQRQELEQRKERLGLAMEKFKQFTGY
ncbi:hypothetical protein SeLEV6574_g08238 [Synchytrium endobioticum]|uniref:Dynamin GTPase domain-containing protein n=1 Tax=Synchytrium endobioticum TaxID=286115 RepID=A0A507C5M7_9FUNG|nr:hypothetical protein SeLEV6574_g08238 [Synchytrium endobioticum]